MSNLKSIVDKLQTEKAYFITQVEKLKFEKKQLIIINKNLTTKINIFEKDLQKKVSM